MKILNRISNALRFGAMAFLKPKMFNAHTLEMMTSLFELIIKVQKENIAYMCKIGTILPEKEEQAIATIWVGAGKDSSPYKRIDSLIQEKIKAKKIIEKCKKLLIKLVARDKDNPELTNMLASIWDLNFKFKGETNGQEK